MRDASYNGKPIILSDHAVSRFLERKIPEKVYLRGLSTGVKISNHISGRMLCVYKAGKDEHYTMVVEEEKNAFIIVTAYRSSTWEMMMFKRLSKHGANKD